MAAGRVSSFSPRGAALLSRKGYRSRFPIQVNAAIRGCGSGGLRVRPIHSRQRPWHPPSANRIWAATMLSRRQALTAAAGVVAGLAGGALAQRPASASLVSAFVSPNRIPYGACVRPIPLQNELDYRNALQTYCQQLTPEAGLFWGWLRPTAAEFRFDSPTPCWPLRRRTTCPWSAIPWSGTARCRIGPKRSRVQPTPSER